MLTYVRGRVDKTLQPLLSASVWVVWPIGSQAELLLEEELSTVDNGLVHLSHAHQYEELAKEGKQ